MQKLNSCHLYTEKGTINKIKLKNKTKTKNEKLKKYYVFSQRRKKKRKIISLETNSWKSK
jgi:hypothetical protein